MFNQEYQTKVRRIKVISSIVVLFAVIGFLIYLAVKPAATCNDGKQNQGEKGIDCGGPCGLCKASANAVDLVTKEIAVTDGGNGTYDIVAKVYNPNDSVGAKKFDYTFSLKDANGNVIATKQASSFILPVDTRYVAQLGIATQNGAIPATAEIKINKPEWAVLGDIQKPQLGVYNKKFDKQPIGEGSMAQGIVRNESSYDLTKISIVVVLRDAAGKIIGVNITEKSMVRAGEQQEFRLNWPYSLGGNIQNMEVDAQSNVLDPDDISWIK